MASVNRATLLGYVGRDPEIRYLPSGDAVANFTLATTDKWKDKSGELQERTEWHRVEVFGGAAKVIKDYVNKGSQLYVEGQIAYDEWVDKDGNKRNTTRIKVSGYNSKIVLLGSGRGKSERNVDESPRPARTDSGNDDDLPF